MESKPSESETQHLLRKAKSDNSIEEATENGHSKLRETIIILTILFIQLLCLITDFMPASFLSYEIKQRGLTELHAGIIIGVYDLARFLFSPFCTAVIRRLTAKKAFIIGAVVSGATDIGFGLIGYSDSPIALFIVSLAIRALAGAASALTSVSATSILMLSKYYSHATIYGLTRATSGTAVLDGFLAGGTLYELLGYASTFVLTGGCVTIFCFLAIPLVPNPTEVVTEERKGFLHLLMCPAIVVMASICAVVRFSISGLANWFSEWIIYTFDTKISMGILAYAPTPLCYVSASFLASWTVNKGHVYAPMIVNWVSLILCFLLMCPSPILLPLFQYRQSLALAVTLSAIIGFNLAFILMSGFKIIHTMSMSYGYDGNSLITHSIISGVINFAMSLGSILGPPLSGLMVQKLSFPWTLTVISFGNAAMLLIFVAMNAVLKLRKIQKEDKGKE